jgi:hypothetical protein
MVHAWSLGGGRCDSDSLQLTPAVAVALWQRTHSNDRPSGPGTCAQAPAHIASHACTQAHSCTHGNLGLRTPVSTARRESAVASARILGFPGTTHLRGKPPDWTVATKWGQVHCEAASCRPHSSSRESCQHPEGPPAGLGAV